MPSPPLLHSQQCNRSIDRLAQRDNRPRFPKRRRAAAGRDRAKPIDRRQGQGKTNSAAAMNSPNQVHFFFHQICHFELLCTERWSRESGSVAAASSGPRRLELAVLTAYLAGESFPEPLTRPNPHPRILSALVYCRRMSCCRSPAFARRSGVTRQGCMQKDSGLRAVCRSPERADLIAISWVSKVSPAK